MSRVNPLQISPTMLRDPEIFTVTINTKIRGLCEIEEDSQSIEWCAQDSILNNAI
jgi:hypothetical protein